jgi:hypothetical protein
MVFTALAAMMRNGRDRRSENPFLGHAKKERVSLFGTDQRITSGPAARRPHYMTAPERFADSQIPLAPRAPSIHDPKEQVAFYDDGVGTSRLKPLAWFGGMFGYGLKRNLLDCYKFICRNYEPGAEIFLYGFSRGAFTVRVLADLALDQGLVPYYNNEPELQRLAIAAYRAYRKSHYPTGLAVFFRPLRDLFARTPYSSVAQLHRPSIRFIGVWDTVAAYGFPVVEITRFVSRFIWPLELPDTVLDKDVRRACHAISLDDERTTFHPVLWTEKDEKPGEPTENDGRYICAERISQVEPERGPAATEMANAGWRRRRGGR